MSVLLVDWLGRGGIAQTSEAWVAELRARGREVHVVTRADRELGEGAVMLGAGLREADGAGRIGAHRAVIAAAVATINDRRPTHVVVQNYVLAPLERPVFRAARRVGAQTIAVVHDDKLHTPLAGSDIGLTRVLRDVDVVVAHTDYVASRVRDRLKRDVVVIPHPVAVGALRRPRNPDTSAVIDRFDDALRAVHFGVLRRRYKGTDLVEDLAGTLPGWTLIALGVGAPDPRPGLVSVRGYVPTGDLVATVGESDVALLPYRRATQSGAVVLAQALGVVPVVSALGGIPEQVIDGEDGVLMTPGADADEWRTTLAALTDEPWRKSIAVAARDRAWCAHEQFATSIGALVA